METLVTVIVFMFLGILLATLFSGLFGTLFMFSFAIMAVFAAIVVYFLPLLIASVRKHPHALAIALINIFLGWCLPFWIIALIWSLDWHVAVKNWYENKNCKNGACRIDEIKD